MAKASKVIITCAVTGSIHTPSMSPHLPITPDEIADMIVYLLSDGSGVVTGSVIDWDQTVMGGQD